MLPRAGFTRGGHFSGNPWEKMSKIYVLVNGQVGFVYVCMYRYICRHSQGSFIARISHRDARGKHRENPARLIDSSMRTCHPTLHPRRPHSLLLHHCPLLLLPLSQRRASGLASSGPTLSCVAFPQNPLCRADMCLVAVARAGRTRGRTSVRDGRAVGRRAGMGLRGRGYCRLDRIGLVGG